MAGSQVRGDLGCGRGCGMNQDQENVGQVASDAEAPTGLGWREVRLECLLNNLPC